MSINGFLGGLVAITAPVLLGVAVRGGHHRRRRRRRRAARHRPARAPAHRRPDRRRAGARLLRHLGHAEPRAVRHRPVRHPDARRRRQRRRRSKGLFYGGGADQLMAQLIGSLRLRASSSAASRCIVMYAHQADPGHAGTCGSRRTASSRASTSTSTALPAYHMEFGHGIELHDTGRSSGPSASWRRSTCRSRRSPTTSTPSGCSRQRAGRRRPGHAAAHLEHPARS